MSVKVTISESSLNSLNANGLRSIFEQCQPKFAEMDYFKERYKRKKEIAVMVRTEKDTELKPMVCLENELVDTAAGYGLGKPVTYYDKSDDNYHTEERTNLAYGIKSTFVKKLDEKKRNMYLDSLLKVYEENNTDSHDLALLRDALITGSADEMIYTNEEGEIEIARVKGHCIAFYNNAIKPKMIGFAREVVYVNPVSQSIVADYELYTKNRCVKTENGGEFVPHSFGGMSLNPIPFVRYDIGDSYIAKLIAEIRCYELVTDNTKKILNYNDDAILMIRGYMFEQGATEEEINKAIETFRTKGTIFLDSEDDTGAAWLKKEIDDGANENHKKNLKDDIYTIAGTFNPSNDNMVYQNTLSLMFKLYGLENKMVGYMMQFKKSFNNRCKLVSNILSVKLGTKFDSTNIDMTFTRNLPTNINEELNLINQAKDFLPLEELYKMVSFVENPKKMVEKWKEWQLELTELEIEKNKKMSEATEDDMLPNRLKDNE